jgi:subtilisin family serine protease
MKIRCLPLIIALLTPLSSTARSVKVIVLDSGYSAVDPLTSYIRQSYDFTETSHFDTDGHGTHILSLISDNGSISKKHLELISIKIFNNSSSGLLPYLNALKKTIEIKPDIVNLSYVHEGSDELEEFFLNQISQKGTKIVVAAGNGSRNLDKNPVYPCSYHIPNLICVGNKSEGHLQSDSNFGKAVHSWENGDNQVGQNIDGSLQILSGTSQSAAIFTRKLIKSRIYQK